jgi:hypothetical protein
MHSSVSQFHNESAQDKIPFLDPTAKPDAVAACQSSRLPAIFQILLPPADQGIWRHAETGGKLSPTRPALPSSCHSLLTKLRRIGFSHGQTDHRRLVAFK